MQHLNLNHLFYFYTIATEGSIRDACEKLSLTQSTLSNQLKELEMYFGEPLFDRKSKSLILNDIGKNVLTYAAEIFRLRDELTFGVKNHFRENNHVMKVGFVPSFMRSDIYCIFRGLWDKGRIVLKSTQDSLPNLLSQLESKVIDVILSDRPILHHSFKLKNKEIFKKQLVFVGNKNFVPLTADFPASLNNVPFCAYNTASNTQYALEGYFKTNNISPHVIGEFDDVNLLKLIAEDGKAVVAIPAELARESMVSKRLFQIGAPFDLHVSTWVLSLFDYKFDDYLQKCLSDIIDGQVIARAN
ncbi:MAG: LysR family transcriptional regulator [Bdellovibrio sp.]|nr:LysR family transcriptional regulator [Bdellovibrio sp.]